VPLLLTIVKYNLENGLTGPTNNDGRVDNTE